MGHPRKFLSRSRDADAGKERDVGRCVGDCVSFTLGFLAQAKNGKVVCEIYINGSRIDALYRVDTPLVLPNAKGCSRGIFLNPNQRRV